MPRIQRFSIKKLSVGVRSVCIGYAFLSGTVVQADVVMSVAETAMVTESDVQVNPSANIQSLATTDVEDAVNHAELLDADIDHLETEADSSETPVTAPLSPAAGQEVTMMETPKVDEAEPTPVVLDQEQGQSALTISEIAFRATTNAGTTSTNQSASEILTEKANTYPGTQTIASLSDVQKQDLNTILVTNFETKADEVALKDVLQPVTSLNIELTTKYLVPTLTKLREEAKKRGKILIVRRGVNGLQIRPVQRRLHRLMLIYYKIQLLRA